MRMRRTGALLVAVGSMLALTATLAPLPGAGQTSPDTEQTTPAADQPSPEGQQAATGDQIVIAEAPRQVTGNPNPTRLFDIPALAVHPDDPQTVVMAVGDARLGGCGLRVSRDGGLSWATTVENMLPEQFDSCLQRPLFPVMDPTFAPDGTLHVPWPASSGPDPDGPISMLAGRTSNLGRTFEVATVAEGGRVTADPGDFGQEGEPAEAVTWHKAPSLVVDPTNSDRLYLGMRWNVWGTDSQSFEGDVPFRPWVAISEDGGETWNERIDMVENSTGEDVFGALHHDLVATSDGTLYAFTRSWPAPAPEGEERDPLRLLMFKSTDNGQTWDISPFLEEVENFRAPYAAVNPNNDDIYVVYTARKGESAEGEPPVPQEIFFTASRDSGETWSDPVQINDSTDRPADRHAVNISVAPNGRIDVAFHDFRNDPFQSAGEGTRYWDVYHTYSTDRGRTWSSDTRVTETFIDANQGATYNNRDVRGPTGLASTNDAAYIAWPDSRATGENGDAEDVYLSRLRFVDEGQPVAASQPAGGDTGTSPWVWLTVGAGAALAVGGLVLLLSSRGARSRPEVAG